MNSITTYKFSVNKLRFSLFTADFYSGNAKRILLLLFCAAFGVLHCEAQGPDCNVILDAYVYNPYRLVHIDGGISCNYAIGTIKLVETEPDGDYHVRLKCDPEWEWMLNSNNNSSEDGCLCCEIICACSNSNPESCITQSDAKPSCEGYKNQVYVPTVGEHVMIVGAYVWDTSENHGWNELHPVTSVTITSCKDTSCAFPHHTTGFSTVNADKISVNVFPDPAANYVNFQLNDHPSSPVYITITDASGRGAGRYQMMANTLWPINTTYYADGVYYYTVVMDEKIIKSGKFAVIH